MPVDATCCICGKVQSVPPSRAKTYRTCSYRCQTILRVGHEGSSERVCQTCGVVELVSRSKSARPYCSRDCYAESLRVEGHSSPTWWSWRSAIRRCTEPTNNRWKHYGGRGITVCDRWTVSFENFLEDMGVRPEGRTLDRIDPDGDYEPGNCRWATAVEQRANRRDS